MPGSAPAPGSAWRSWPAPACSRSGLEAESGSLTDRSWCGARAARPCQRGSEARCGCGSSCWRCRASPSGCSCDLGLGAQKRPAGAKGCAGGALSKAATTHHPTPPTRERVSSYRSEPDAGPREGIALLLQRAREALGTRKCAPSAARGSYVAPPSPLPCRVRPSPTVLALRARSRGGGRCCRSRPPLAPGGGAGLWRRAPS
jgi:hypothetical protein